MNKSEILAQLFMREGKNEKLVPLSDIDSDISSSDEYNSWINGKREFLVSDVANSHWIKTCTGGYITEVIFHAGGTLDEYTLFDRVHTSGKWLLEEGLLKIEIHSDDNRYNLNVVACRSINIHSAIEYENGELHSYLKLSQVK